MNRKTLLSVAVLVEGGLFLTGYLLLGDLRTEVWATIRVSWIATGYVLLLCLPMLIALYITMRTTWPPLSRLREEMDEKVGPIFANSKLVDLAVIAFFAGVGEELFFRGWMQSALIGKFGVWLGILIASLVFGFAHYLSKEYAIYAFITGIYLGLIYYVTGNLFIVMAVHANYDFIALIYVVRKGKQKTENLTAQENM